MPSEPDRERLDRIKRETAYAAGPVDGAYVTRRGKPLEITVKMADLDWLIETAERVARPDVVRPR